MTLPPLEARKNYVAHRVESLMDDAEFIIQVSRDFENDAFGPSDFGEYARHIALFKAEREWAERMDVLLDADINNLELHR